MDSETVNTACLYCSKYYLMSKKISNNTHIPVEITHTNTQRNQPA